MFMSNRIMPINRIVEYVQSSFEGIQDDSNWGERALFYNPERQLPKGIYFLTFKEKDGVNDSGSKIGPGQYRLNVGLSKPAFIQLFGSVPSRPAAAGVVDTGHDFTLNDTIMPHPVYGWMGWVAVKNPSEATLDILKPLLDEAYRFAQLKFNKRIKAALAKAG